MIRKVLFGTFWNESHFLEMLLNTFFSRPVLLFDGVVVVQRYSFLLHENDRQIIERKEKGRERERERERVVAGVNESKSVRHTQKHSDRASGPSVFVER